MENFFTLMHHIDVKEENVTYKEITNEDAEQYILQLTQEILTNSAKKKYRIDRQTTEVISQVLKTYENKDVLTEERDIIANRLLTTEVEAQRRIEHLGVAIKKGSLIQSFFIENEVYYYLISKIEADAYLDETDLHKRIGLRYEDKAFKNCLIRYDVKGEIEEILISDKNAGGTDYWHNLFLELKEITTNESNSKDMFNIVESVLKREFKDSPAELTIHKNQLRGYFETKEGYSHDECINYLFGSSETPKIRQVKEKIITKAEKAKLDSQFAIEKTAISKSKWKETKQINDYVELTLKGHEEQIKSTIKSYTENGEKYIAIKVTDNETYKSFDWNS